MPRTTSSNKGKGVTVSDLAQKYLYLEGIVKSLSKDVSKLTDEQKKLVIRFNTLERFLEKKGILIPMHRILAGEKVWVYFWLTKAKYKVVKLKGLKRDTVMMGSEWAIFSEMLKNRGLHLPKKLLTGYLTVRPHMIPQVAVRMVVLKSPVDARFIYVGNLDAWENFLSSTSEKARIEYLKVLASTITPISIIKEGESVDFDTLIAFITKDIPPQDLIVTQEQLKYIHFGEVDRAVWDEKEGWYKV